MHVIYCTDYSNIVSVTTWVNLQKWKDDYVIISSTENLAFRLLTCDCDVVIFDYLGSKEVVDILGATVFLENLQVMAGSVEIAKQYRHLTDNIFVLPPVIDLSILFWSNQVFSLDNIEKNNGQEVINNCLEDLANCKSTVIKCDTVVDKSGASTMSILVKDKEKVKVTHPKAKNFETYQQVIESTLPSQAKTLREGESKAEFRKRQVESIAVKPNVIETSTSATTIKEAKDTMQSRVEKKGLLTRGKYSQIAKPETATGTNSYQYFQKVFNIPKFTEIYNLYAKRIAGGNTLLEDFLLEKKLIGIDDYLEYLRYARSYNVLLSDEIDSYTYGLFTTPETSQSNPVEIAERMGLLRIMNKDSLSKHVFLVDINNTATPRYLNGIFDNPLIYLTHKDYILSLIDKLKEDSKR